MRLTRDFLRLVYPDDVLSAHYPRKGWSVVRDVGERSNPTWQSVSRMRVPPLPSLTGECVGTSTVPLSRWYNPKAGGKTILESGVRAGAIRLRRSNFPKKPFREPRTGRMTNRHIECNLDHHKLQQTRHKTNPEMPLLVRCNLLHGNILRIL